MNMIEKVQASIEANELFAGDAHLLLAISGGVDSMVMLSVCLKLGYKVSVAHCNFNLRGEASNLDEDLVRKTCGSLSVPCYVKEIILSKHKVNKGGSIQQEARDLRYLYFEDLRKDIGADKILTAHHFDDQIETFFYNFSRGVSLKGLRGIPRVRGVIVRPLLDVEKSELYGYAKEKNIAFREDESNQSLKYKRNLIRHEMLPIFEQLNPSFKKVFRKNLSLIEAQYQIWEEDFALWKKKVLNNEGGFSLSWEDLSSERVKILVKSYLHELNFDFASVSAFINSGSSKQNGKFLAANAYRLFIERSGLVLVAEKSFYEGEYALQDPSVKAHFEIRPFNTTDYQLVRRSNYAAIDQAKIKGDLRLRKWREGDRFQPLGMKGQKKLSDFFIDEKFSQKEKEEVWLLCDEKNIIWIVGWRMDDRYKITNATTALLEVKYNK